METGMFKRFIARFLILLQIYGIFFQGVIYAGIYDDLPGEYRVTIGAASADIAVPTFRLFSIDPTTREETLVEDLSLEGVARGDVPLDIAGKEMTPTPEGLVWDVDGLQFMATTGGQLVIKGSTVRPQRKWTIQNTASVLLDGVNADHFDISSPLLLTTGILSIDALHVRGIGEDAQWINQGTLTANQSFIENLWMVNEGSAEFTTRLSAERFLGGVNKGVLKGNALVSGQGVWKNETTGSVEFTSASIDGAIINEGTFKSTVVQSTARTSVLNKGTMHVESWRGKLDDLLTEGTLNVERASFTATSIRNSNIMRLGTFSPIAGAVLSASDRLDMGSLKVDRLENRGQATLGDVVVKESLKNTQELTVKSVAKSQASAVVSNEKDAVLKSEAPVLMLDIDVDNKGTIEGLGDTSVAGRLQNTGLLKPKNLLMRSGSLVQDGTIRATNVIIEPSVLFTTTALHDLEADLLEIKGAGTTILEGDTTVKRLLSTRTITGKGIVTAKNNAQVQALQVPAGGKFTTGALNVEGDITTQGAVTAKVSSTVKGNITVQGLGKLGLAGFSSPLTPKTIRNEGQTVIEFTKAFADTAGKGQWTVHNSGGFTIDQKSTFTPGLRAAATPHALSVLLTNARTGHAFFAYGDFRFGSSVNDGILEYKQAHYWSESLTNRGVIDLKEAYFIGVRGSGARAMGTTRSTAAVTIDADAGVDVAGTLKRSPIQTPALVTVKKAGDVVVSENVEFHSPLFLDITGNLIPRAELKAKLLTIKAYNVQTDSLGLGKVISSEGLLDLQLSGQFINPTGIFFGKTGIKITAPRGTSHGSKKARVENAWTRNVPGEKYPWVPSDALLQTDSGNVDITTGNWDNVYGRVRTNGQLIVNANIITNTAGEIYARQGGHITAKKLIVKRDEPNTRKYYPNCPGHTEYNPCYGMMRFTHNSGSACQSQRTDYTEQSGEGILKIDGDLVLNVDETEVVVSQITVLGNVWFKTLWNWRNSFDSSRDSLPNGLKITSRGGTIGALRAGQAVRGTVAGTATFNGHVDVGSVNLSAFNYAIGSLGVVGKDGRPLQLLNMTNVIEAAVNAGNPLMVRNGGVVEHVLPISLAREVARLPLFQSTDTAVPGRVHQGTALPLLEDLARQFIMGLRHQELGMGDASLRTLCDNAYRFAEEKQRHVRDAEARNASGSLVKFGRVQVTEEDLVQAAYAMFYYKIKEGVARTAADIQAAQRLATGPRVTDAALSAPTLEAYLLIPAQQAPKSVIELTARDGNFHLQADQRIDAVRGRETVHEGDAIKGRIYERHLDPVLISAPKGKVILDAPEGNLDHVNPTARDGVEIAPGITKNDTGLASTSWDYTKEFLRQQAEEEMRGGGGLGGMMGGGVSMFPETAAFQFNFGGSGPSVSGFSPGGAGQHYSQINDPLKRAAAKARQEADARFRAANARIDNFFGQMGGGDIRARVIPNGIVAQMEHHAFQMQQEHAWHAFEQELEEITVAAYEDDEASAGAGATPEEKAVLKTITNTAKALEKAVIKKATSSGNSTALIDGLWDAESYRTKQALEATIRDTSLSEKVRMGAEIALELATEGMMALHGEVKANPAQTAGRAVATGIEVGVPFGDAALRASNSILAAGRGEFEASGSLFLAAVTSGLTDLTVAGAIKKVSNINGAVYKAVSKVGIAFQERYAQKVYESQFKSMSGKIHDVPITWTAPVGTGQTYKIWQRTDIDWSHVRTSGRREYIGKTNAAAAHGDGLAPQLSDGSFATLHHIGQDVRGAIVEATTRIHKFGGEKLANGKTPFSILHGQHGVKKKHPEFPVDHDIWSSETKAYWKYRIEG